MPTSLAGCLQALTGECSQPAAVPYWEMATGVPARLPGNHLQGCCRDLLGWATQASHLLLASGHLRRKLARTHPTEKPLPPASLLQHPNKAQPDVCWQRETIPGPAPGSSGSARERVSEAERGSSHCQCSLDV